MKEVLIRPIIRRPIDLESLYKKFPPWLKVIPVIWHAVLFLVMSPRLIRSVPVGKHQLLKGKRVLLVDDVLQSGKTLAVAKECLRTLGCKEIHSAVLADVRGKELLTSSVTTGIHYYPWSRSSSEYHTFLQIREMSQLIAT